MQKKNWFPIILITTAAVTAGATVLLAALYHFHPQGWLLSAAITFGTTCYHFSMRLLVGALIPNRFDPGSRWFQPRKAETALYKKLRDKRWKDHLPTYDPRLFSMQDNTLEGIVKNTCQAEIVHEVIIVCSFLPMLASLLWGEFWVFAATTVIAALLDSTFVMLQRYNRPRLMRLLGKKRRKD